MTANISYYPSVKNTKGDGSLPLDIFLDDIKNGRWQNEIIDYRSGRKAKVSLPAATISGEFSERKIKGLVKHSGHICIDMDDVDNIGDVKAELCADRFVAALWTSVGGKGLAALFRIDPRRHRDAFDGLGEYLFNSYGLVIDPSCKDVSRARFVSHDPEMYVNGAAAKFTSYPKPKPKALKKLQKTIFVRSDFEDVVQQITARNLDLVDDYHMWVAIAFAFADKFAEGGRNYFHIVSRPGQKYDAAKCDKQFSACMRHKGSGVTMNTFYWLCKQAGIEVASKKTKLIATTASQAKKGGRKAADTIKLLKDLEDIPEAESKEVVQQVFENDIDYRAEDGFIYELETWLRQNYDIRRNIITRKIEEGKEPMEQRHFNSVYMQGKRIFEKELSFDLFSRLIDSDFTPDFNPLKEWLQKNKEARPQGNIEKLCRTINTNMSQDYVRVFAEKWLAGIIESVHGEMSPLMLVLAGEVQNTGKTEFFRRLLPREIRQYYAESKLDQGKDDEILMTQKLIIMDDEMGGKSKRDAARMKELTSKKWFSLREPYGRQNVDLKRLAVLAGTSNDTGLLNDPTGNRRIIPIYVVDIDKELYNSIDKTDLLMEVYWKWKEDGLTSGLDREQIQYLNAQTRDFEAVSIERELVQAYFEPAEKNRGTFKTTTDIKVDLERFSGQRITLNKLGQELRNLGFERVKGYTDDDNRKNGYYLNEKHPRNTNSTQGVPF